MLLRSSSHRRRCITLEILSPNTHEDRFETTREELERIFDEYCGGRRQAQCRWRSRSAHHRWYCNPNVVALSARLGTLIEAIFKGVITLLGSLWSTRSWNTTQNLPLKVYVPRRRISRRYVESTRLTTAPPLTIELPKARFGCRPHRSQHCSGSYPRCGPALDKSDIGSTRYWLCGAAAAFKGDCRRGEGSSSVNLLNRRSE